MKILADIHISPVTVNFLKSIGYDVVRASEILRPTSSDKEIVESAITNNRVILTQDLDFSEIIALSGKSKPSLISLRLSSSRIEYVNSVLEKALPLIKNDIEAGAIVSVEDNKVRTRKLPF